MTECTDSKSLTDWLTALGTVGSVIVALVFSGIEFRKRRVDERRKRGSGVNAWFTGEPETDATGMTATIYLDNTTNEPVYDFIATVVKIYQEDNSAGDGRDCKEIFRCKVQVVPPGKYELKIGHPGGGAGARYALELAFRDTTGTNWKKNGVGQLKRICASPLRYYDISVPTSWASEIRVVK